MLLPRSMRAAVQVSATVRRVFTNEESRAAPRAGPIPDDEGREEGAGPANTRTPIAAERRSAKRFPAAGRWPIATPTIRQYSSVLMGV